MKTIILALMLSAAVPAYGQEVPPFHSETAPSSEQYLIQGLDKKFDNASLPDDPKVMQNEIKTVQWKTVPDMIKETPEYKEQQKEIDDLKKQVDELKKTQPIENPSKPKKHTAKHVADGLFGAIGLIMATRTYNNGSWNQYPVVHPITGVNSVNPMTGSSSFNGVQW